MRNLFLLSLILSVSACGAIFSDNEAEIAISVPTGSKITLDGRPVSLQSSGYLRVSNHKDHIIEATKPDGTTTSCAVDTHVQARYVVGDCFLFETLVAPILDAVTADWSAIEDTSCSL